MRKIFIVIFIFLIMFNGNIYSANEKFDLEFLWRDSFDYRMLTDYANPLIDNDKLYFAVRNVEDYFKVTKDEYNYDFINIYNIENGEIIERIKTVPGGSITNPFKLDDLIIFVRNKEIRAYKNFKLIWKKLFDSWIDDVIYDNMNIYVNALLGDKNIIKLTKGGQVEWDISLDSKYIYGLKQDEKYVYTIGFTRSGEEQDIIYKIDKKIGKVVMKIEEDLGSYMFVNYLYIIGDSSANAEEKYIYIYI